eukprot:4139335-Alexandrium_andersonii.AAC.1
MSASLVGSEMCIRDSSMTDRTRTRTRCKWGAQEGGLGDHALSDAWRPAPVSYTHLTLPTICSV